MTDATWVWTVYRYYDADDQLLYVGITGQGLGRSDGHRRTVSWWPLVARGEFEHFTDSQEALRHETTLIVALAPLYNRAENPRHTSPRLGRPRRPRRSQPKPRGPVGPKRQAVETYLAEVDADSRLVLTDREIAMRLHERGVEVSPQHVGQVRSKAIGRNGKGHA